MFVCSIVYLHVRVCDSLDLCPLWVFTKVKCLTMTFSLDLEVYLIEVYDLDIL